jgi:hypothetical protein
VTEGHLDNGVRNGGFLRARRCHRLDADPAR